MVVSHSGDRTTIKRHVIHKSIIVKTELVPTVLYTVVQFRNLDKVDILGQNNDEISRTLKTCP
jgi:hypothetical protein